MAFRRRYAGGHQLLCKIIRDGTTRTDNTKRELLFPVGGLEGEGTDGLSYPRFRNRRKFDHVRCARPENGARTIKHKHRATAERGQSAAGAAELVGRQRREKGQGRRAVRKE